MIEQYRLDAEKRLQESLPSLPLTPNQTSQIKKLIEQGDCDSSFLLDLLVNRIEPGVSKSAQAVILIPDFPWGSRFRLDQGWLPLPSSVLQGVRYSCRWKR